MDNKADATHRSDPRVPGWYPSHNGGWYTGESFASGAPYANVAIVPDAAYMMETALQSANPPPGAAAHVPGGLTRPGNNTLRSQHVRMSPGFACTPALSSAQPTPRFVQYQYL